MGGKLDQIKGRLKEATGVLADNNNLKREGKLDQMVGKVKEKAEWVTNKMRGSLTGNSPRRLTK